MRGRKGELLERFLNRGKQLGGVGRHRGAETGDHLAISVDQELSEVPANPPPVEGGLLVCKELVERDLSEPLTDTLANIGKVTWYLRVQEGLDLLIGPRLLP